MMHRAFRSVALSVCFLGSAISQDVVTLKSGRTVQGKVVRYKDGKLTIRYADGKERTGPISVISSIEFAPAKVPNQPLDERALTAWKLARSAAQSRLASLSKPNPRVRMNEPHERYRLLPETRKNVTKTRDGDWVVVFPAQASYYNRKRKKLVPEKATVVVKVVDYGSELRVESCGLKENR